MSGYTNDVTGQYDSDEDPLRLEVTRPALDAGLVVEDADGSATRLAKVYVYGFDDLLLVVDAEHVSPSDRAVLVASAAQGVLVIHDGGQARLAGDLTGRRQAQTGGDP
jgi:hypothetical protein